MFRLQLIFIFLIASTSCDREDPRDAAPHADGDGDADVEQDRGDADGDADPDVGPTCEGLGQTLDGERCTCDEDCADGAICLVEASSGSPGGLCYRTCELGNLEGCGHGAVCADVLIEGATTEGMGMCLQYCQNESGCSLGRTCSENVCVPHCQQHTDCLSGFCDVYTGNCTDPSNVDSGAGVMEPCLRNEDCLSQHCGSHNRCVSFCDLWRDGCPDGTRCVPQSIELVAFGICYPECGEDETCPLDGLVCANASYPIGTTACLVESSDPSCLGLPKNVPDDGPCGCHDDCGPQGFCLNEYDSGWPSGRCHKVCDPARVTEQCHAGFVCDRRRSTDSFCLKECTTHTDCGAGYVCIEGSRCYPSCESNDACLDGSCDRESGLCRVINTEGLANGEPCDSPTDCRSSFCLFGGPDFICTRLCLFSNQACPLGSVCAVPDANDVGICLKECTTATDCGYSGATCAETGLGLPNHCL